MFPDIGIIGDDSLFPDIVSLLEKELVKNFFKSIFGNPHTREGVTMTRKAYQMRTMEIRVGLLMKTMTCIVNQLGPPTISWNESMYQLRTIGIHPEPSREIVMVIVHQLIDFSYRPYYSVIAE